MNRILNRVRPGWTEWTGNRPLTGSSADPVLITLVESNKILFVHKNTFIHVATKFSQHWNVDSNICKKLTNIVFPYCQKYKAQVQRIREIAVADTSSFAIPYGSDTSDGAYQSLETFKGSAFQQCKVNSSDILDINNFIFNPNFSHVPDMSLHDPNNYKFPTYGESYGYTAGLHSFGGERVYVVSNARVIGGSRSNVVVYKFTL